MDQIGSADAGLGRLPSLSGVSGASAGDVRPLEEGIDLAGAVAYAGTFPVCCGEGTETTTELRVGEAESYLFVRVRCAGMMVEVSSGLQHEGVRCEAWHGVSSGANVKGRLQLQCALKPEGAGRKLDVRVRAENAASDTLIYGSSRYEGAVFRARAQVGLHEIDGAEEDATPTGRCAVNGRQKTGHGRLPAEAGGRRRASRVKFCEADEWYEYEVPKLRRAGGKS